MSSAIQCQYYRNGQLREEVPLRKGRRHGTVRTWHKNGVLASEETYRDGLLHGVCRQWNESGKLLGKCRLVHGTGIQRAWHDNGQLQLEVSTVRGEFCGRNRIWLRDGTLIFALVMDEFGGILGFATVQNDRSIEIVRESRYRRVIEWAPLAGRSALRTETRSPGLSIPVLSRVLRRRNPAPTSGAPGRQTRHRRRPS